MIEPAALGKSVVVGPWTQNFADAMRHFLDARAITEADDGRILGNEVDKFLKIPSAAASRGRRAQEVVRRERGATARNVEVILNYLK